MTPLRPRPPPPRPPLGGWPTTNVPSVPNTVTSSPATPGYTNQEQMLRGLYNNPRNPNYDGWMSYINRNPIPPSSPLRQNPDIWNFYNSGMTQNTGEMAPIIDAYRPSVSPPRGTYGDDFGPWGDPTLRGPMDEAVPAPTSMNANQVNNLYQSLLGRQAGEAASVWTGRSHADVLSGIRGSQEYINRNTTPASPPMPLDHPNVPAPLPPGPINTPSTATNQAQLNRMYQQHLGRSPAAASSSWLGMDQADVLAGIMGSQEYRNRQ